MRMRKSSLAALAAMASLGLSAHARAATVAGLALPDEIRIAGTELQLNGTGLKEWFFLDLYAVGLYLEKPTSQPEEAIGSDQIKRVHVHMLRNVSGDRIAKELRTRIQRASPNYEQLADRVEQLAAAIPNMRKGFDFTITYFPGIGTVLSGEDGSEVLIEGKDFADALMGVFLGSGQSDGMQQALFGRN